MPFPLAGQTIYGAWTQKSEASADLETRLTSRGLSAYDNGIVGGNVGDQTAAINAFLASAAIGATVIFPPDTYAIAGTVICARSDIRIIMYGAKFKHSGTGIAFTFDGQAITNGMRNVEAYGGEVDGNANTTIAWRFIDMGGNRFFYQRARNCSQRAFSAEFCVLCEWFNPRCTTNDSVNEGNMTTKPTTGFFLGKRNVNENTSDCILYNPEFEGLPAGTGIDFQDATANTVIGGSPEGNSIGYNFGANAQANTIVGGFTEVNTTSDVVCAGFYNSFINCFFRSVNGSRFTAATCYNNRIIGGSWYLITIDAGVLSTLLDGVAHDLAIVDNGAKTQYRNVWRTPGATYDTDRISNNMMVGATAGQTDTGETLQVNGSAKLKKLISATAGVPVPAAGAGAGTGPTLSVDAGATDRSYVLNVTTGTAPTGAGAIIATIPFNVAYPVGANVRALKDAANAAAAALNGTQQVWLQFDRINVYLIAGTVALAATTLYKWTITTEAS